MARTKQSAIEKAKKEAAAERRRRREEASSRREGEQVDYRDEMMEAIVSVERAPGDFACQGSTPGLIMGLEVDGKLVRSPLPAASFRYCRVPLLGCCPTNICTPAPVLVKGRRRHCLAKSSSSARLLPLYLNLALLTYQASPCRVAPLCCAGLLPT